MKLLGKSIAFPLWCARFASDDGWNQDAAILKYETAIEMN